MVDRPEQDNLAITDYLEAHRVPTETTEEEVDDDLYRYERYDGPFGDDAPECLRGVKSVTISTHFEGTDDGDIDDQDVELEYE